MATLNKYDICAVCDEPLDGKTGHPKPPGKGTLWAHPKCKQKFRAWSDANWDLLPDQSVFRK